MSETLFTIVIDDDAVRLRFRMAWLRRQFPELITVIGLGSWNQAVRFLVSQIDRREDVPRIQFYAEGSMREALEDLGLLEIMSSREIVDLFYEMYLPCEFLPSILFYDDQPHAYGISDEAPIPIYGFAPHRTSSARATQTLVRS